MVIDKIATDPEIGLIAGIDIRIIIEEEETTIEVVIETTDPITGIIVGPKTGTITEMGIGTIIDQITEGMIVARSMEIEIMIMEDPGREVEIGVVQEKVPDPGVALLKIEMMTGDKVGVTPEIKIDLSLDPDQALV